MEDKQQSLKWLDWLFTLALGVILVIAAVLFFAPLIIPAWLLFILCGYNLWDYLKRKRGHRGHK